MGKVTTEDQACFLKAINEAKVKTACKIALKYPKTRITAEFIDGPLYTVEKVNLLLLPVFHFSKDLMVEVSQIDRRAFEFGIATDCWYVICNVRRQYKYEGAYYKDIDYESIDVNIYNRYPVIAEYKHVTKDEALCFMADILEI